jgi:hypothetical protein
VSSTTSNDLPAPSASHADRQPHAQICLTQPAIHLGISPSQQPQEAQRPRGDRVWQSGEGGRGPMQCMGSRGEVRHSKAPRPGTVG